MKSNIILFLSVFLFLRTLNLAAQGLAPRASTMQEVEASGSGITESEAFKQAVVDAVRQVVGTLVVAENVVSNDKIIKDKILTLSNGFVDKVITQSKTKQRDGSWLVNLKCVVRKGQVYGKLQEANVPTIKFDGASLFANVVSQLDYQQSAIEMIQNALNKISPNLITASMLEGTPKIVERDDSITKISFTWTASVDVDSFFKNCAPALDEACRQASSEQTQKTTTFTVKESKELGVSAYGAWHGKRPIKAKHAELAAILAGRTKNKWTFKWYHIDHRILEQLPKRGALMKVVAYFRDTNGNLLIKEVITYLKFMNLRQMGVGPSGKDSLALFNDWEPGDPKGNIDVNFSMMPMIESHGVLKDPVYGEFDPKIRSTVISRGVAKNWENEIVYAWASRLKHETSMCIPTSLLPKISKIELSVEALGADQLFSDDRNFNIDENDYFKAPIRG